MNNKNKGWVLQVLIDFCPQQIEIVDRVCACSLARNRLTRGCDKLTTKQRQQIRDLEHQAKSSENNDPIQDNQSNNKNEKEAKEKDYVWKPNTKQIRRGI